MTLSKPRLHLDITIERDGFRLDVALESTGGVLVLVGPSGAGKSTTLHAIAGLVTPSAGQIVVDGEALFRRGLERPGVNIPARSRRVGYVFQDYALFPHLTALDNVAYPLWRRSAAKEKAMDHLCRVGLADFADRYPHQLSGGQQQRVAIARGLASDPRILLLDEPFSALDIETRRHVRAEIRGMLEALDLPVVLVTHDREEALALGDAVAVMDRGRVIAQGEPLPVLGHPTKERVARLSGVENILRLKVKEVSPSEGVMRCGQEGFLIEVPLSYASKNDEVSIGVRAEDVLLASMRPEGLSAGNLLPGTIKTIEPRGPIYEVEIDCGARLVSHVTARAVRSLGLAVGVKAWAVIKTTSCHVLQA